MCYCDNQCKGQGAEKNWFKVGQIRLASYQMMSESWTNWNGSKSLGSRRPSEQFLTYVFEAATVVFQRSVQDQLVMGLAENGIVKIISDNNLAATDSVCRESDFDATLVEPGKGHSEASAYTHYRGVTPGSRAGRSASLGLANSEGGRLVFNNDTDENLITIRKAGVIAICYCQFANAKADGRCDHKDYWVLAVRTTIRGPTSAIWSLSTHTVFSLEYYGYGLDDTNKLRIISGDGKCSDNNRNPDKGSFDFTYLQVKAPQVPTNVGAIDDEVNGDLQTQTMSSSKFDCNNKFENCKRNDIRRVEVISDTETEVEFELPPMFDLSDVITMGDNVLCDETSYQCTPEKLMILKGVFDYRDKAKNAVHAPDTFMVGHKVMPTANPLVWRLQLGWKDDCFPNNCVAPGSGRPKFKIVYNPASQVRGQWQRRNRATTKWEIKGIRDRQQLRVCWNYGGQEVDGQGNFVAEVGLLTLTGANPMQNSRVSLTTSLKGEKAPMVISFQTAGASMGVRYVIAAGMTQLKLVFSDTSTLEGFYSDSIASNIENNASEDELSEAKQFICGRLFKELWSGDAQNGFPLPKGCYYRKYGDMRELFILFAERNGLRPGQEYQIVMHGAVYGDAKSGGKYLEIFTMDDVSVNPYLAIERGEAALSSTPVNQATSSTAPRWLTPGGFRIMGGTDNVRALVSGDSIQFELSGSSTNIIMASAIVRVYLWPLTIWKLTSTCSVICTPKEATKYGCGTVQNCEGVPTVLNSNNNVIKITLPASMTPITGPTKQQLTVLGVPMPKRGWFPSRVGAQVRMWL